MQEINKKEIAEECSYLNDCYKDSPDVSKLENFYLEQKMAMKLEGKNRIVTDPYNYGKYSRIFGIWKYSNIPAKNLHNN